MLESWTLVLAPKRFAIEWAYPTREATLAAIAVCILALIAGGIAGYFSGDIGPRTRTVLEMVAIPTAIFPLNAARLAGGLALTDVTPLLRSHSAAWMLLGLAICPLLIYFRHEVARAYVTALLVLSPLVAVNVVRAAIVAARTDYAALHPVEKPLPIAAVDSGMRVLFIVFDEMDYNLAFPRRSPTIALPSFDRLRSESLFATNAHSPEGATQFSMPSYILGQRVSAIVQKGVAQIDVRVHADSSVHPLSAESTMFSDAFQLGARTELAGFYLPYCSLSFAIYAQRCTAAPFTDGGVFDGPVGFGHAIVRQLLASIAIGNRIEHIRRNKRLAAAAVRAASDPFIRFAFLHLPTPHTPPIWSSRDRDYTLFSFRSDGYLGNLELADRTLAQIVDAVQRAGLANRTTMIVTADHPWRGGPIDGEPAGKTIPFIVRLPDHQHVEWSPELQTVCARALVRALLSGSVATTPGLEKWLDTLSGS